MKLEKFDLQKALNGAKVVTRDGKELTQLHIFANVESHYPVYGCIENGIARWTTDGCFLNNDSKNENDLFIEVEIKSVWVNVYKIIKTDEIYIDSNLFKSEKDAINGIFRFQPEYIKTIEITDQP
jgi:hypothetical protein